MTKSYNLPSRGYPIRGTRVTNSSSISQRVVSHAACVIKPASAARFFGLRDRGVEATNKIPISHFERPHVYPSSRRARIRVPRRKRRAVRFILFARKNSKGTSRNLDTSPRSRSARPEQGTDIRTTGNAKKLAFRAADRKHKGEK